MPMLNTEDMGLINIYKNKGQEERERAWKNERNKERTKERNKGQGHQYPQRSDHDASKKKVQQKHLLLYLNRATFKSFNLLNTHI